MVPKLYNLGYIIILDIVIIPRYIVIIMVILGKMDLVNVGGAANTPDRDSIDELARKLRQLQILNAGTHTVHLFYSFTKHGAITAGSTFNLKEYHTNEDFYFPAGSQIIGGRYQVTEQFASATDAGTLSAGFATDDAAGILAAAQVDAATWTLGNDALGLIQTGLLATDSEDLATVARPVILTGAVEDLTAGEAHFSFVYEDLDIVH